MRNFCLLLGLVLLPGVLFAVDHTPVIRREVGKCAAAWQRSDFEGIVSYLPPRVIAQSGGRGVVLSELRDQFAQARALGVEQLEAVPGRPSAPRQIGRWLTTLIPTTAILRSKYAELTQQTHVLGLSNDQGKRWFFVLLYQTTPAELNAWFPELAGKIVIPPDPLPKMSFGF